jgi:hypothetical protein
MEPKTNPLKIKEDFQSFNSEEELSEQYDKCIDSYWHYDEKFSDEGALSYTKCWETLKRSEHHLIHCGMFSPNEELKEIHTEKLK